MSRLWSRLVAGAIALPVAIGLQQWPSLPAVAAGWKGEVQQTKSVPVEKVGRSSAKPPATKRFSPAATSWPTAEEAAVDLHKTRRGELVRAGKSPIRVAASSTPAAGGEARVRILDRKASDKLVGPGVVAVIQAAPGSDTTINLDYSGFASAVGAGFGNRLRLVALPECALTTPELPACQQQTDLASTNDPAAQTLTATITDGQPAKGESKPETQPEQTVKPEPSVSGEPEPTAEPTAKAEPTAGPSMEPSAIAGDAEEPLAPTPTPAKTKVGEAGLSVMVVAAAAAAGSDQGDYSATSLKPSSAWATGGSSGELTWSYPLRVPNVPGATAPSLEISYASGSTDGGVSNTNNQASWIGEGFELANSFIERKYANCYDDRSGGNNSTSTAVDQCWYTDSKRKDAGSNQPWDNAFLSMDGHSGELVRAGNTADWRLEKDDGTRVRKLGNTTDNNEYWRVTTPDGTQYFFGKGKSDGASAKATNSVWSVPVFGNHTDEPGRKAAFKDSAVSRPWRWNLDYVISTTGNTVTYFYAKETNKYKKNLATSTAYDRGGYLTSIQYGERKGAEVTDDSPALVKFTVEERCDTAISSGCKTATPTSTTVKAWPDVPMDMVCETASGGYCPSQKTYPTFFSRKRLAKVETFTRNSAGTAWEAVDSWALTGSFPAPSDGGATPSLWLSSIRHTGGSGATAITLPPTTLTPVMLDSRITGAPVKLEKPRLGVIVSETGTVTSVEYSTPECTATTLPTAQIANNTTRCMPVYYSPDTTAPKLSWFNKYVVTSVAELDPITQADMSLGELNLDIAYTQVTTYTYADGGAWRYDDSPMTKEKYRTWSQWRGYRKVTTVFGTGPVKEVTEDTYFRGMNGDKAASGTKTVKITDSTNTQWPDENWYAGMLLETRTLKAVGGAEDSGSIMEPKTVRTVHTDGRLTSRQVDVARTVNRQKLATGSVRTTIDRIVEWDPNGQPLRAESEGDTAVSGDETCTRTTYATPTDLLVGPIDRVAETNTMPALCATERDYNQVLTASRHYYGSATLGTVTGAGLETKTEHLRESGASRNWIVVGTSTYDQWGRATQATDALGNTSTSSYTHSTGGLLTESKVNTADPDGTGPGTPLTTTTTYDTRLGVQVKTVQPGGQTTEGTYDALGRTTAVWQPGRPRAQTASATYTYVVSNTAPSTVTTKTLLPNGTGYSTSITLLDSMLRPRQTQTQGAVSGRLIEDTRYDSRGNAVLVDSYHNTDAPSTTLVQPSNRISILTSHRYSYDFAGRETKDAFYSAEALKWATTTSYEGDRVKVVPPAGGTPSTVVSDVEDRTTQLIQHLGADTSAPGVTTSYSYDAAGNLAAMTDAKGNKWSYTYDLAGNKLTAKDPDKGLTTMSYNVANQLTSSTDARGVTLKFFYDNLGRATKTTKADGTTLLASTVYDTVKKGLVSSTSRHLEGGTITSRVDSYDTAGRATSATTAVPQIAGLIGAQLAGEYTDTTSYNPDGSIGSQTLPAAGPLPAETLAYGYTATGRPRTLTGTLGATTATYVSNTNYLEWGKVTSMLLGTHTGKGIQATFTYDPATLRLATTNLYRQVNPGVSDEATAFSYDPAGNITQVKATLPSGAVDNQCFSYDHQQQLTDAWTPTTAGCDPAGRSQAGLSGPAPYWTSWATDTTGKTTSRTDRTPTTSTNLSYSYPADGPEAVTPHFVTGTQTTGSSTGSASYSADPAGNTISRPGPDGQQTLVWNEQNQLTEVKTGEETIARMVYDANGARILRQQADTTTLYLGGTELTLTGAGTQPPLQGGDPSTVTGQRYYTHTGSTIAVRTGASNDTITTLIADHQGTTHHQITNATGDLNTLWQDPYGNKRGTPPAGWTGERSFVGGTQDATGLIRIGARDYDPVLQRFITVDPIQDLADPLQWNPYLYANNTPITKADPTGLYMDFCFDTCRTKVERKANQKMKVKHNKAAQKGATYKPKPYNPGPPKYSRPSVAKIVKGSGVPKPTETLAGYQWVDMSTTRGSVTDDYQYWSLMRDDLAIPIIDAQNWIDKWLNPGGFRQKIRPAIPLITAAIGTIVLGKATATTNTNTAATKPAASGADNVLNGVRLRAQLTGEEISGGHAFQKHVIDQAEFPGIKTRQQFASHIEDVVMNGEMRTLGTGRTAYWKEGTVVIRNPRAADGGTAFRPTDGYDYFLNQLH